MNRVSTVCAVVWRIINSGFAAARIGSKVGLAVGVKALRAAIGALVQNSISVQS